MLKYRSSLILATGVLLSVPSPSWSQVSINFEGIGNAQPVGEFYASRSVHFAANFVAYDDARNVFDNPPSPVTVASWPSGSSSFIDHDHGFVNNFSFSYTSHNAVFNNDIDASVEAWSGTGATGLRIGSLSLPDTPRGQPVSGNPGGFYRVWHRKSFSFLGQARSIRFVGNQHYVAVDDLSFEAADPCNVSASIRLSAVAGLKSRNVGSFAAQTDPRPGGRMFLDTVENGAILGTPDRQRLKFTAQVTPASVPANCFKVRWEVRDPDDPATHAGVDSNGSTGGDNTGAKHEGVSAWFTQADHAISNQVERTALNESTVMGEARTSLGPMSGALGSTVFFHGSDDGGDNFLIRAVLVRTNNQAVAHEDSGLITMWRQRSLHEFWMAKPADDKHDTQRFPLGSNPGQFIDYIFPGDNGQTDTLILGGDDRRAGQRINTGMNGIVETTKNSGTLSADADLSFLRSRFAEDVSDNLAYIDWRESIPFPNRLYVDPLRGEDFPGYMHSSANSPHQTNGLLSLLGADFLFDPVALDVDSQGTLLGMATPPHAAVAAGEMKKFAPHLLSKNIVHELGHLLIGGFEAGASFHGTHTTGSLCAFTTSAEPRTSVTTRICPRHAGLLRDSVSREPGVNHIFSAIGNDSVQNR